MRNKKSFTRRHLLGGLAAVGAASAVGHLAAQQPAANRRIRQSVVYWCFNSAGENWNIERTCQVARELGCLSVEIVPPEGSGHAPCKHRSFIALYRPQRRMKPGGIPSCAASTIPSFMRKSPIKPKKPLMPAPGRGFPNVILPSAALNAHNPSDPKSGEISRQDGADNCVRGLREVVRHAEKRGVTICMEHLNTRDGSHPMKGHPGYQGDDLDWMAAIIRRVNSPRLKLLFDVYHVQIMHGDILRRIEQNRDIIGHVHTAGNPGRGELDDRQEINYPAVMRKLVEINYTGYVGQEFIPTRNPLEGLRQAVRLCDV